MGKHCSESRVYLTFLTKGNDKNRARKQAIAQLNSAHLNYTLLSSKMSHFKTLKNLKQLN